MSDDPKLNPQRGHDLIEDLAKEMRYKRSGGQKNTVFGITERHPVKLDQSNQELLDEWMKEKPEDDA